MAAGTKSARKPSASRAKAAAKRGPARAPVPERTAAPTDRTDLFVAGGVALVAGALFLTTFSSNVALGDAPETVAGVRTLGILHAPGYITYVLAARVFGEVLPIGGWASRVNLFSVVCAALTVALTYLLARAFAANRAGAVVGSFALATTASFWFNAGFAKHYAFSGLLVVLSALLVVRWQEHDRTYLLVAAGALLGLSLGAGWQLAFVMGLGLVVLLVMSPRRPRLRAALCAAAAVVVTTVAVCVLILVRAGQDPTINFGSASTLSRLYELLATSDFGGSRAAAGAGALSATAKGVGAYLVVLARDIGIAALLIGLVGAFDVVKRRRWDHGVFLAVVGVGNIVAVAVVARLDHAIGFYIGMVSGGLLIDVLVVIAVLAALGTTRLADEFARWAGASVGSSDGWLTGARVRAIVVGLVAIAVIAPSLIVHYRYADHRQPPLSDRYATRVFAALPPNSVLLSGGFEFGQPLVYQQVVDKVRPDVAVVTADQIVNSWYRERLVRQFGLDRSLLQPTAQNWVVRFVDAIRQKRPVFADTYAMYDGKQLLAFRAEGFVAQIVDGSPGPQPATGSDVKSVLQKESAVLQSADTADGLAGKKYLRFPNLALYYFHERAHVELAKQYAMAGDLNGAADEIDRARIALPNDIGSDLAAALRANQDQAKQVLLGL